MGLCCFSSNPVNLKNVIEPSKKPVNTIIQTKPVDEFGDMPPLIKGDTFPMELGKKISFDNFIDNFETISCKTKRHNNRLYIKYQYMDKFLDFIVYTANDKRFISINKVSVELELFNSIYTVMAKDENSTIIIFNTGKDITIDCPTNIVIRALSDNFFNECSDETEAEAEAEPEPEEEIIDTSEKQVSKMIDNLFEKPSYTLIYFATILLFGLTVASTTMKHPYDI